ncbi:MAG: SDR family oxidoreductase [Ignavibacteriaceae bacterium]|nr:SDR family oxidoreductase [Ignavibacteriaceae bacterium]
MRIFITGGSGLLGQYLNTLLSVDNEIFTIFNSKPGNCNNYDSAKADITDYNRIHSLLNEFKPEVIIHTAAISSVQMVDKLPSKFVYEVNVNATRNLAELSSAFNSKLIYTSTDLVYAGYRGSMLTEDSKLIPASFYAETKLMGEEKIKEVSDNYVILRTGLLYGFGTNGAVNHFNYLYQNLKNNKPVKLFYDQYRTPLSLWEAARIISSLVNMNIQNEILNFGGKERVSRLELCRQLCLVAGFDCSLLEEISMYDIPGIPDAADVSMNTDKLQSLGITLKNINESLKEIIEKYIP